MATLFATVLTGNQELNRVQANIQDALVKLQSSAPGIVIASTQNVSVPSFCKLLVIPTTSIANASSGIQVALPDATKNPGMIFAFKKTDTSGNVITFSSAFKNKQGTQQTVENGSSYSPSTSLASGWIFSDSNNWWVIS